MRVMTIVEPVGRGTKIAKLLKEKNNFNDFLNNTPKIKVTKNSDDSCLLRAILLAKLFADKNKEMYYLQSNQNSLKFNRLLRKFCMQLNIFNGPCGMKEIESIEEKLVDYQITVIDGNGKFSKDPIYLNRKKNFQSLSIYVYIKNIIM